MEQVCFFSFSLSVFIFYVVLHKYLGGERHPVLIDCTLFFSPCLWTNKFTLGEDCLFSLARLHPRSGSSVLPFMVLICRWHCMFWLSHLFTRVTVLHSCCLSVQMWLGAFRKLLWLNETARSRNIKKKKQGELVHGWHKHAAERQHEVLVGWVVQRVVRFLIKDEG